MLAAADWVFYAIPIIAFLVYLLSTALRPQQSKPPVARPKPAVFPPSAPPEQAEVPMVQPVQASPQSREVLEEFLRRGRRSRRGSPIGQPPVSPQRRVPTPTVEEPRSPVPSRVPTVVPTEPVVVLPPSAIISEPSRPIPSAARAPQAAPTTATPHVEFRQPPTAETRRTPLPALVVLNRFLARRDDLRAAFLLREILGPPKALQVVFRQR